MGSRMFCMLSALLGAMLFAWAVEPAPVLPEAVRTGMLGWYDAADAPTLVLADNGVSQWQDKSGQHNDLVQDIATSRPQLVHEHECPVVQNMVNGFMMAKDVHAMARAMTVYALVKTPPANSPIISFRAADGTEFCAAGWTIGAHPTFYTTKGSADASFEIEDSQWHLLTFQRDGATRRFYVDGMPAGTATGGELPTAIPDFHLFAYQNAAFFTGKLAELLIFRVAHDEQQAAQVHDYLLRKWAPLFTSTDTGITAFVGNSMTTGMYCGSGKTWPAQTAAQIPALTHWYNLSRGGATTQQLDALSVPSLDRLVQKVRGNSVLVFWEGTNDLVVNTAKAEEAHERIKAYCQARRKAGWKKIILLSVLPREAWAGFEPQRQALNQLLREHYTEYADALVDISAIPGMGRDGDQKTTAYYADGVHLTAKGNGLVADMLAPVLAKVLATK